jgi:hypothetical protein
MVRRPPHLPQPEPEGDTLFNIAQESIDEEEQGRFARPKPHYIGRDGYPRVARTPLTGSEPDRGYVRERDTVDEPTSMTTGVNLNFLPGTPNWSAPLEPPSANSAPDLSQEQIERVEGGSSLPRGIEKIGDKFRVTVGLGLTREVIGYFDNLQSALAALKDAQQARE